MKKINGLFALFFFGFLAAAPLDAVESITTTTTTFSNSQEALTLEDFEKAYEGTTKPGRANALAYEKYQEYKNSPEYPDTTLIVWPRDESVPVVTPGSTLITTTRTMEEPVTRTTVKEITNNQNEPVVKTTVTETIRDIEEPIVQKTVTETTTKIKNDPTVRENETF